MKVTTQTDGACSGNLGSGGWAFALTFGARTLERFGQIAQTTNNAAELTAVLAAVRAIKKPCIFKVTTDSTLVMGLLAQGWKRKNPALRELCEQIEAEAKQKGVVLSFVWTKGHASNTVHNRIDTLARREAHAGWVKRAFLEGRQGRGSLPVSEG